MQRRLWIGLLVPPWSNIQVSVCWVFTLASFLTVNLFPIHCSLFYVFLMAFLTKFLRSFGSPTVIHPVPIITCSFCKTKLSVICLVSPIGPSCLSCSQVPGLTSVNSLCSQHPIFQEPRLSHILFVTTLALRQQVVEQLSNVHIFWHQVFQFLLDNFRFHDFSVNQFLAGYR